MMKVLIAGEGGQGIQAIAEILAKAAFLENKKVLYIPNFGVEQRGGVSLAFVVINDRPVVYPKFAKTNILAILSERSWERVKDYIDPQTKVIKETNNMTVLGKINKIGKIVSQENLIKALEERFAKQFAQNPGLRELDIKALTKV